MLRNIIFCLIGGLLLVGCAVPGHNTHPKGDVMIRNTYPPGGIQSRDKKTGIGVDVKSKETHRGSKTTIAPFIGENPDYNRGWRADKKRMQELIKRGEYQIAIELAREDASLGEVRNYERVPGKFVWAYNKEFDRYRLSLERRARQQYERDEYRRGRDEFREGHPEYGRVAREIEQIRHKARIDARDGIYDPQGFDERFLRDYEDAYEKESRRHNQY